MAAGARKESESFGDYRKRLRAEQYLMDAHARGICVFDSGNGVTAKADRFPKRAKERQGRAFGYSRFKIQIPLVHRPLPPRISRKGRPISGSLPRLTGY